MSDLFYDFSSPFMTAAIITDPGKQANRYPLWTNGSTLTLARGSADKLGNLNSLAFLTEMTIALNLGYVPTITATLSPPFEDALKLLDSGLLEWGSSVLEVQFGYTGGSPNGVVLSPRFTGTIFKPDISFGIDATVTLHAQGTGSYSATRSENGKVYNRMSRRKMIELAALHGGLEVDFSEVEARDYAGKTLDEVLPSVSQQGLSDWFFIWQLVRESGCWLLLTGANDKPAVAPNVVRVIPINKAYLSKPRFTMSLFNFPEGKIGPAARTWPILGVTSPNAVFNFLPASTRAMVMGGSDSKTAKPATAQKLKIDRTSPDVARSDVNKAVGRKSDSPEGTINPSDPNDPRGVAKMTADFQSSSNKMGTRLEIDTLGMPEILPGEVVRVEGIGHRLEGNFAVFKVTHHIGSSGYSTKLELYSNSMAMSTKAGETVAPTLANTSTPPDTGDTFASMGVAGGKAIKVTASKDLDDPPPIKTAIAAKRR